MLQDVLDLRDLAREVLDDRDLGIFFAIHFSLVTAAGRSVPGLD